MANTLTPLIPNIRVALDTISREMVGLIPAVSRDGSLEQAAKDQTISSHVVPAVQGEDITPGEEPADSGDTTVGSVTMTLDKARAFPVRWTGEEERSVKTSGQWDQFVQDRFAQAMRAAVNEVEADIAAEYVQASRAHGTAGTTPFGSDVSDMAEILKILKDNGAPQDMMNQLVIDTSAGANMRSQTQLTDVNRAGSDDPLRRGVLLDIHGFSIRESAGIKTHSGGTVTSVTVDGAHAEGATSIALTVSGSLNVSAGDVIDFGGDHKYVVAAAATGTPVTIAEPGLQVALSGGETVSAASDFAANMAFHRSALHLATRVPAAPESGDRATDRTSIQDPISGLAFEVAAYPQYRQVKYEVGLVWGTKGVKPEHMALLLG